MTTKTDTCEKSHPSKRDYEWINPREASRISGQKVVLFGAGRGTEEFLSFSKVSLSGNEIVCITDNDSSFWGKKVYGYEIFPPHHLEEIPFDMIVVTSVSGREAISIQLREMGYREGREFVLVGRYPPSYLSNFTILKDFLLPYFPLEGKHLLHIGPGGFLGLETLLYCLGADHICSIDKYGFGISFPEVTGPYEDYMEIRGVLESSEYAREKRAEALSRFDSLFLEKDNRHWLDTEKIAYHYPMDVCALEFEDETFDGAFSFAVLEHVTKPSAAVKELVRVVKNGGFLLHVIVTRDHRSFSKAGGYDIFSFRSYSAQQWEELCANKYYQNRLLPLEWNRLFEESGLRLLRFSVDHIFALDHHTLEAFHPDFKKYSPQALGEVDCMIFGKK